MRTALILCAVGLLQAPAVAREASAVAGLWRGESLCATEAPACHNEKVVYDIADVPGRPEVVFIRADKIVDGKTVNMGAGEWQYDRARQTLEWRLPQQVWLLQIAGARIEGALTLDGTVFRKMTLEKDR